MAVNVSPAEAARDGLESPAEGVAPVPVSVPRSAAAPRGDAPDAAAGPAADPPPAAPPLEPAPAQADLGSPGQLGALAQLRGLDLFSLVAHELRGPLMALATSAELLVADVATLDAVRIRDMVGGIH